jgi:outer membrane protein with beta-barrel domain
MNMKFAASAALISLAFAAYAPQAAAADNGFYLGAGITQTNFDLEVDDLEDSTDDNGWKIIAGWRPLDFLAVEANYSDLGGLDEDGVTVDSKVLSVNALLLAEIGIVDLYAKVGYANWDSEIGVSGVGSISDDGWEPTYGAGVGVHFGSVGVRAEYEFLSVDAFENAFDEFKSDSGTLSLSVTYTFL